jgi:hypothetical protein
MERIFRDKDENLYQPKIHSDRIRELYKIGTETGLPLTVLVDYAIRSYVNAYEEDKRKEQEAQLEAEWKMENETTSDRIYNYSENDEWEDGSLFGF